MSLTKWIDAAYPGTDEATIKKALEVTGATVFPVYVPGWGDPANGASVANVSAITDAGAATFPILVPYQKTITSNELSLTGWKVGITMALKFMEDCELVPEGQPMVALDVEAGWYDANPNGAVLSIHNFAAACASLGVTSLVYSSPVCLNAVAASSGNKPARVWAASWVDTEPTQLNPITGLNNLDWNSGGQRAWQWSGGSDQGGLNVDRSIAEFTDGCFRPAPPAAPTPTPAPTPPIIADPIRQALITLKVHNPQLVQDFADLLKALGSGL